MRITRCLRVISPPPVFTPISSPSVPLFVTSAKGEKHRVEETDKRGCAAVFRVINCRQEASNSVGKMHYGNLHNPWFNVSAPVISCYTVDGYGCKRSFRVAPLILAYVTNCCA